jgi:hypothetical protein
MPHNGVLMSKKMTVVLEGPYGLPSIDLVSGYYSVFMLIGGGIGEINLTNSYLNTLPVIYFVPAASSHSFDSHFGTPNHTTLSTPISPSPTPSSCLTLPSLTLLPHPLFPAQASPPSRASTCTSPTNTGLTHNS